MYSDHHAASGDRALCLHKLLCEIRDLRKDYRSFAVFERRDDLAALGIDYDLIDAADVEDDAALDLHIADCRHPARIQKRGSSDNRNTVSVTAQAAPASPFGEGYTTMYPKTYRPEKSNGLSAVVTPEMIEMAKANASRVAPDGSGRERMMFGVPDGNGGVRMVQPPGKARSYVTGDTLRVPVPADALWAGHGHLKNSDGFVDAPDLNDGWGDASTLALRRPMPNFTLFNGQQGWHDLDNGQARFTYPSGSMTADQIKRMQEILDVQQIKLQGGK